MNYFVILAAGKGNRFISKIPKQYTNYNGKKMIFHSIQIFLQLPIIILYPFMNHVIISL